MGHNERTLFREHIKARLGSFLFVGVGKEERKARQVVALCCIPDPASLHFTSRLVTSLLHLTARIMVSFPLSRLLAELRFAYAIFDFLSIYDRAVANAVRVRELASRLVTSLPPCSHTLHGLLLCCLLLIFRMRMRAFFAMFRSLSLCL
jgi:hypothetical protein